MEQGACAAQPIGGYLDIHRQLEKEIADFVGQEDAILFSSGFGANAGLLRAILGKNDIAYIDSYIHTSAMSGLIGTNTKHIGHNDIEYLDMILDKEKINIRLVLSLLTEFTLKMVICPNFRNTFQSARSTTAYLW